MKNTRIIAAITAALVGGFVLGGLGIASAGISTPHAPSVASVPVTGTMTSATWMHASQPTTTTATPVVPRHRASAAHAAHRSAVKRAAHRTSTASHATHRTATSGTAAATHQCSTTCPTHHPATSQSHDGDSGENHGGCND